MAINSNAKLSKHPSSTNIGRVYVPADCVTFYIPCIISENQLLSTSMSCTSARTGYHIVHVLILINPAEQKWKVKRATVDENTKK